MESLSEHESSPAGAPDLRTVIDHIADGIITLDADGVIRTFNCAACRIFGYTASEIIGQNIERLMPPDMRPLHQAGMQRRRHGGASRILERGAVELPALRRDGTVFPLELSINAVDLDGSTGFVGIVRDISERKHTAALLYGEKERLRVTLRSIGDAVISADTRGAITDLNSIAEQLTGWAEHEAAGLPLEQVCQLVDEHGHPDPLLHRRAAMQAMPNGAKHAAQLLRRDGTLLPVDVSCAPIRDAGGAMLGVVTVFHDVSQARAMAQELSYQARHDTLTGLINRREFERRLRGCLQQHDAPPQQHALLYMDLDQFKIVNDTCGHAAGDELLRQLSGLMAGQLRHSDTLARLGGDEFGVLLEGCALIPAQKLAEALRRTVEEFRYRCEDKQFQVSASIGLAVFSSHHTTIDEVLRRADAACYVAKDKGRNRLHIHTSDDQELARRRGEMGWLGRIRKALEEQRFVLLAQRMEPLSGAPGQPHYELLVRMVDQHGELIAPAAFIPAAERYGMMPAIDRWVIGSAFAGFSARQAQHAAPCHYAINLSASSICDDSFLPFVLAQFKRYGVPPSAICFELTETQAIANLTEAATLILRLKEIGCRFALDDFGCGMASFSYLKHLPVDYLKIDGSFVRGMVSDLTDRAMVEAINHVGHVMQIRTIAEFAESEEILQALRDIGVDYAQGYAIDMPSPW